MAEKRLAFWRRHRWMMWTGICLLFTVVTFATVVAALFHWAEPFVKERIIAALEVKFHSRVELDSFHLSLMEGFEAEGKGLRIWPPLTNANSTISGPIDSGEPLIRLNSFRFHVPFNYQRGKPLYIGMVHLDGLFIDLPPREQYVREDIQGQRIKLPSVVIDSVECKNAHLKLETNKSDKLPMEIAIAYFKLTSQGVGTALHYEAELTNPKPVGSIHALGTIGPWSTQNNSSKLSDPGLMPIQGNYKFEHADLSCFRGIAGILNSTGHYQGTLRDLAVVGEADVPDFRLTHFGTALSLHTKFNATVDGTNGDTWLNSVDATLAHSHFTTRGSVVRAIAFYDGKPQSLGHNISLIVNVDRARIEDFIRLMSHPDATPILNGAVYLKTTLDITPGSFPLHVRMKMKGNFTLDEARFVNVKIQKGIQQLSLRGQGHPEDVKYIDPNSIGSRMISDFAIKGGLITLPNLQYTVPGAAISLKGTYRMGDGAMDFSGTAKMQATISQMVGGWKGILLKPADRYFQKDGAGTLVPIHLSGTREDPQFGADLKILKHSSTSPEIPGTR